MIFSKPFRRLARKTQVHPLAINDHTHNRLTHSLEVGAVGRSLGKAAFGIAQAQESSAIPATAADFAQLVQAACLAHDVGNTPFGHAGERAIRLWMADQEDGLLKNLTHAQRSDLMLFEGNAQAFRLTTRTVSEDASETSTKEGGIALTAATLATMLKYPWHSNNERAQAAGKYSAFQSDLEAFDWVVNATGLIARNKAFCRHPLTFLVEAADDICNSVIDIEDALELNILKKRDVSKSLCTLSGLEEDASVSQMRASAIGAMINATLGVFSDCYLDIMEGRHETPLIEDIHPNLYSAFKELNSIAQNSVYPFQKLDEMEKSCINTTAQLLYGATHASEVIPTLDADEITQPFITFSNTLAAKSLNDYERLMRIMDFVAGMTDNYAVNLSARIAETTNIKQ